MFLDDELNEIAKEGFSKETAIKLIKACAARLPKPDDVSFHQRIKVVNYDGKRMQQMQGTIKGCARITKRVQRKDHRQCCDGTGSESKAL